MITSDSRDYHLLVDAVQRTVNVPGLTCEIGVRGGGGSEVIMRQLAMTDQTHRTHIGIDPYGNIDYPELGDGHAPRKLDYTNNMRDICIQAMYKLAMSLKINYLFFPLEDTEFFKRYADGVPVYQEYKSIVNQYAVVHFDGPHTTDAVIEEFNFFKDKAPQGAVFVFDDVTGYYDHNKVEQEVILPAGWSLITKTSVKASYLKV